MEGRDFCGVALEVREIEVVGQRSLKKNTRIEGEKETLTKLFDGCFQFLKYCMNNISFQQRTLMKFVQL